MSLTSLARKLEEQKKINSDTLEGINRVGDGVDGLNKNFSNFIRNQERNKLDQLEAENKKLKVAARPEPKRRDDKSSTSGISNLAKAAAATAAGVVGVRTLLDGFLSDFEKKLVATKAEALANPLDGDITLSIAGLANQLDKSSLNSGMSQSPTINPTVLNRQPGPKLVAQKVVSSPNIVIPKPIPKPTITFKGSPINLTKNMVGNTWTDGAGNNYSVKDGVAKKLTGGADALVNRINTPTSPTAPSIDTPSLSADPTTVTKPLVADPTMRLTPPDIDGGDTRLKSYQSGSLSLSRRTINRAAPTALVAALDPVSAALELGANTVAKAKVPPVIAKTPGLRIASKILNTPSFVAKGLSTAFRIAGSVPGMALQFGLGAGPAGEFSDIAGPMRKALQDIELVATERGKGGIAILLQIQNSMKELHRNYGDMGLPPGDTGQYAIYVMSMATEELKKWADEKHFFRYPEKAPGFDPNDMSTWESYKQIMDYNTFANTNLNDPYEPIDMDLNSRVDRFRLNSMKGRGISAVGRNELFDRSMPLARFGSRAQGERNQVNSIIASMLESGQIAQVGDTYIIQGGDTNIGGGGGGGGEPMSLPAVDQAPVTQNLVSPAQ
jgi:hypothetical protein